MFTIFYIIDWQQKLRFYVVVKNMSYYLNIFNLEENARYSLESPKVWRGDIKENIMTNNNNLTFSALERIQRMKKGSALFRVSKSLVREVCRKQGKRVCSMFSCCWRVCLALCVTCKLLRLKLPETGHWCWEASSSCAGGAETWSCDRAASSSQWTSETENPANSAQQ